MKTKSSLIIFAIGVSFFTTGCSTFASTNFKTPYNVEHTHVVPYSVSLGNRHIHAAMNYNSDQGEILISFSNFKEAAYRIFKDRKAKAVLSIAGQPDKEIYLVNPQSKRHIAAFASGQHRFERYKYTDIIYVRDDFLKNLNAFELKSWLPLGGIVYEVNFTYPQKIMDNTSA
jgi:hypothetical protein